MPCEGGGAAGKQPCKAHPARYGRMVRPGHWRLLVRPIAPLIRKVIIERNIGTFETLEHITGLPELAITLPERT